MRQFTHYLKKRIALFITVVIAGSTTAKEGMWLPPTLPDRAADMKAMGLQIPVDRIYNDKGTGLNNAIVLFGKGCTGEIVSSKGLILTNHHCGYGSVQSVSSEEKDYFASGFWAQNNKEEIPVPDLTVTFIRRMENVTDQVLYGVDDTLQGIVRERIIAAHIKSLEKEYKEVSGYDATIKPYYNGNQYWVIMTETFGDVRLVGFPPNSIGYYGGDFENWVWPRHTGDFSLFRVYAGPGNKPAGYSKNNKPYQTTNYFTLNVGGYKEGDFTMVYGFPAYSNEYVSSYQLNHVLNMSDPISIDIRTRKLAAMDKHMNASREVFIKYTSKRAQVANGWKKWQGEIRGLKLNDVMGKKQDYEHNFTQWAIRQEAMPYFNMLLPQMQVNTVAADSAMKAEIYIRESVMGIELIKQGEVLQNMLNAFRKYKGDKLRDTLQMLSAATGDFYKNYDAATDKEVFIALMPAFLANCPSWVPGYYMDQYRNHGYNTGKWADDVYNISIATSLERLSVFTNRVEARDSIRILADPAWQLYKAITYVRDHRVTPALTRYSGQMAYLNRLYMKGQMKMDRNKVFYPDANFTLRLSYGKIQGLDPEGDDGYSYQTTLADAVAKADPNVQDFNMPEKLKQLQATKNFGRWGVNGTVPLAFTASNHTSGGNSGSPVLNAKGQLIGTNFDRAWEGTMSDYYFDPNMCRNISLDIRYTLFIIEKYGNAGWLLKEMKIVKS